MVTEKDIPIGTPKYDRSKNSYLHGIIIETGEYNAIYLDKELKDKIELRDKKLSILKDIITGKNTEPLLDKCITTSIEEAKQFYLKYHNI